MEKRKILFTINHLGFSNGVCNVLLELANALAKNGYAITIMPIFACDDAFCKNFDESITIKKCFGTYFRGLARIVRALPQRLLYKHFVKENYDIEVAFQCDCPTSILAASTNHKARHIAWMHGYDERDIKYHKKFDKIIACAKSTCDNYKKVFPQPEKVGYLYNLIDESKFVDLKNDPINAQKKYGFTFCTVGRLSSEKGYMRLLKVHKRLMDDGLHHNLWIIGEGDERSHLENYISENHLEESVVLFGFDKNPYKYMHQSDMFVCSSYEEGMSTVCTESLLLGTPVISTLVNGAKELIEDSGCGLVVNNDDESLYEGMKDVLTNKHLTEAFRENILKATNIRYHDRLILVKEFFKE